MKEDTGIGRSVPDSPVILSNLSVRRLKLQPHDPVPSPTRNSPGCAGIGFSRKTDILPKRVHRPDQTFRHVDREIPIYIPHREEVPFYDVEFR